MVKGSMVADLTYVLVGASFVLYGLFVLTSLAGVGFYLRVRVLEKRATGRQPAGVIPRHVTDVGSVMVLFATEALMLGALLDPGWPRASVVALNTLLFAFGEYAVFGITRYEYRRYTGIKVKRPDGRHSSTKERLGK